MTIKKLHLVYFSAANTTKRVMRQLAKELDINATEEYNVTLAAPLTQIHIPTNELLVVGVPVYAGRVPSLALSALNQLRGNNSPAIIVCVYGNRDYDDALLELRDMVNDNGFKVVSAAAFVAQHSIFPEVATSRPDEKDMEATTSFARACTDLLEKISDITAVGISIKGNRPYKIPGKIPLYPKGDKKCNECGTCISQCPAGAISSDNPRKTDKSKCISCTRCIVICPQHARKFGGLIYRLARKKFTSAYLTRKEPELIYPQL